MRSNFLGVKAHIRVYLNVSDHAFSSKCKGEGANAPLLIYAIKLSVGRNLILTGDTDVIWG